MKKQRGALHHAALASTIAILLLIGSAVSPQAAEQFKLTTPIPPGIAMPDTVETRLGTLKFFDGFPDHPTVAKIYDNLDFQRAVQAYLLALAPVNMAGLREGLLTVGPANVTIPTFEANMNARSIFLTANATTPYTWIWLNLHDGPIVAEVPPGVLGAIINNDHWYRWVVDVGLTGPDKGKGGKYLILPPRYEGEVPDGYFVARAQAYEMFLAWRTFPDQTGNEDSAWRTAFLGGYSFERNGIKLLDSSSQYYFYATGVTPAMEARMVGSGSQYALAFVDAAGRPLDVVAATTGSLTLAA